jgi:1-acyl-sn-glycerol-3-phosphate acyltransferase
MSWSGVVRIHGIRPTPRAGERAGVFVANHSSMNDFILLLQSHPYAVVGQKHVGWVGFLQKTVLTCLNCVWFDRGAEDDKKKAADILQRHIQDINKNSTPALIFPEGTCVNNEYVVQVSCAGSKGMRQAVGLPRASHRTVPKLHLHSPSFSWRTLPTPPRFFFF